MTTLKRRVWLPRIFASAISWRSAGLLLMPVWWDMKDVHRHGDAHHAIGETVPIGSQQAHRVDRPPVQRPTEAGHGEVHQKGAQQLVQRKAGDGEQRVGTAAAQPAPVKEQHHRGQRPRGVVHQEVGEEGAAEEGVPREEQPEDGQVSAEGGAQKEVGVLASPPPPPLPYRLPQLGVVLLNRAEEVADGDDGVGGAEAENVQQAVQCHHLN
ncbi:hypothetical protein TYRP_009825 [Tyrophagus putrescentiae]|nr:hypothetical protein TYRP_009825 [Tyrophagus putrescentiae]